jgi:hypothetical protein
VGTETVYVPSAAVVTVFEPTVTWAPASGAPPAVTVPLTNPCGPLVNAAVPSGVPSPVGPSYPGPAVQRYAGVHVPFEPDVTSLSELAEA